MLSNFKIGFKKFFNSNFILRRTILLLLDNFFFQLSFLISLSLLNDHYGVYFYFENIETFYLYSFVITPIYILSGQYKSLTKYLNSINFYMILIRNLLILGLIKYLSLLFSDLQLNTRLFILIWIVSSTLIGLSKFLIKDLLTSSFIEINSKKTKVAILGAGNAGAQLAASLKLDSNYKIISFLDENPQLKRRFLFGVRILSPSELKDIKDGIDQILLAIPSISMSDKKRLLSILRKFDIPILEVPSIDELSTGRAKIDTLRPIPIDQLLGREKALPINSLYGPGINKKVICITGAGGSIGSEIAKQVINLNPSSIILLDNSEPNLYEIYEYLKIKNLRNISIKALLCNVNNKASLNDIFSKYQIEVVFHAAAYKHVPLVEENPLEGLFNNVFSTLSICEVSEKNLVKQVVLISSDKAVRPTNIMGASKRISELIIQAFSYGQFKRSEGSNQKMTLFSMVRFGNVLGSSGSVIPLFKKQISQGGPVTLTHKEMTRYFMTITEAAQLVIQSGVLAEGGDVFLLDMGKPIKIFDLAKQLIVLSGLNLKDKNNPSGDIEIIQSGIRPGEKLYEELLIDGHSMPTAHPLIFKANEKFIKKNKLIKDLEELNLFILKRNKDESFRIVKKLVPSWNNQIKQLRDKN